LPGCKYVFAVKRCIRLSGVDAKKPLLAAALAMLADCNIDEMLDWLQLNGAFGAGRPALACEHGPALRTVALGFAFNMESDE